MAILMDLPDELFYAIGSLLDRVTNSPHLVLVIRLGLTMKVRLPYEHPTAQHTFMMNLRCPVL